MTARRPPRRVVATRTVARRKRRRRAIAAIGVTAVLLAGTAYGTWQYIDQQEYLLDERCEVLTGDQSQELLPHQARNAAELAAGAVERDLPPEATDTAIAISLQERDLTRDGDHGNGTAASPNGAAAEGQNEEDSATELFSPGQPSFNDSDNVDSVAETPDEFYDLLSQRWEAAEEDNGDDSDDSDEGDPPQMWTPEMPLDEASEALDRPHHAQFYPEHGDLGRAFGQALSGQEPVAMTCHLSQLDVPEADPEGLMEELAKQLPATLGVEGADNSDDNDEDEASTAEEVTGDVVELSGSGDDTQLHITVPEASDDVDVQWMLAHWAVAHAHDYGIQSVDAGPYTWQRETASWDRTMHRPDNGAPDSDSATTVTLGFDPPH